jgi:serine/threonine protein kinase
MKLDPKNPPLPFVESRALLYFRQLFLAVEFLHFHHIIHRDIKPDNILKYSQDVIKVADFGVSHIFDQADTVTKTAGTPMFFAPEACDSAQCNGLPLDVWAMGVTLYCFLFGDLPFMGSALPEVYECIRSREPSFEAKYECKLRNFDPSILTLVAPSCVLDFHLPPKVCNLCFFFFSFF